MTDIDRELALRLAKNDLDGHENAQVRAWDEANKAIARARAVDAEVAKARSRYLRIADGGPIEDEE